MNNKVLLLGTYGSDETHACSAWTSTERSLTKSKRSRIDKLIDKLMKEHHHTPFEKSVFHFLVTTDIATHIHLLKHRIGVSINAESARYKELGRKNDKGKDKYYLPKDWPHEEKELLRSHIQACFERYHKALVRLTDAGFPRKRAKESARFYLPYAAQLTADISFNFRSFIHFQILRNSDHAQLEVRSIAEDMRRQVEQQCPQFKLSLAAFDKMVLESKQKEDLYLLISFIYKDEDLENDFDKLLMRINKSLGAQ